MNLIDHSFKSIINVYFYSLTGVDFIICCDEKKILNHSKILQNNYLRTRFQLQDYSEVDNSFLQKAKQEELIYTIHPK